MGEQCMRDDGRCCRCSLGCHVIVPCNRCGEEFRRSDMDSDGYCPDCAEVVAEYVDKDVSRQLGTIWVDNPFNCSARYPIAVATSLEGFAGYVYEIVGKDECLPELIRDRQPDGTWRVRVPKAVRFVKGAA